MNLPGTVEVFEVIVAVRDAANPGSSAELRAEVRTVRQLLEPTPLADCLVPPGPIGTHELQHEALRHLDAEVLARGLHCGASKADEGIPGQGQSESQRLREPPVARPGTFRAFYIRRLQIVVRGSNDFLKTLDDFRWRHITEDVGQSFRQGRMR